MSSRLLLGACLASLCAGAQSMDSEVVQSVLAVKQALTQNNEQLRQYTWTEHTEVLIKGDVKNTTDMICRYDGWGQVQKKPITAPSTESGGSGTSKRPMKRKKAEASDYVERAVSLIHTYLPPKPDRLQYLLSHDGVSLGKASDGKGEIQLKKYWKDNDLMTFTFDPQSKALLKVNIKSYLADEKDPVTLEAIFETLPDGTNHPASSVLDAPAKKLQIKTRNVSYQKLSNQ